MYTWARLSNGFEVPQGSSPGLSCCIKGIALVFRQLITKVMNKNGGKVILAWQVLSPKFLGVEMLFLSSVLYKNKSKMMYSLRQWRRYLSGEEFSELDIGAHDNNLEKSTQDAVSLTITCFTLVTKRMTDLKWMKKMNVLSNVEHMESTYILHLSREVWLRNKAIGNSRANENVNWRVGATANSKSKILFSICVDWE